MHATAIRTTVRLAAAGVVLLVSIILPGCSRGDRPPLGTVTGVVTLDGQPLKNVELAFTPPDGRSSYAETDDEGHYELVYIRDIKGAKVGKHKILVRSGRVDNDKLEQVEVKAGDNEIDIECVSKPKGSPQPIGDDAEV